jgi:hypothetical protein
MHLDVEFFLHSVRAALAPASWRLLAECLVALQDVPAQTPPVGGTDVMGGLLTPSSAMAASQFGVEASQTGGALGLRNPAMARSLFESALPGNPGQVGFWYELYNLFEADAQMEDVAEGQAASADARDADDAAAWGDADADRAGLAEAQKACATKAGSDNNGGPLVGFTIKVSVMHIAAMVVLGDNADCAAARPAHVLLQPGPASGASGDQLQLCVEKWEAVVTQQPASAGSNEQAALSGTTMARVVTLHVHRHDGSHSSVQRPACKTQSDPAGLLQESAPSRSCASSFGFQSVDDSSFARISSNYGGAASSRMVAGSSARPTTQQSQQSFMTESYMDPTMFASAMSCPPQGFPSGAASMSQNATIWERSDSCQTIESLPGAPSEEDSFLGGSGVSSLHSFDAISMGGSRSGTVALAGEVGASGAAVQDDVSKQRPAVRDGGDDDDSSDESDSESSEVQSVIQSVTTCDAAARTSASQEKNIGSRIAFL